MTRLAVQRCLTHAEREAAARCPECRRFFCRECVTEHLGRMMCTRCVAQLQSVPARRYGSLVRWGVYCLAGFFFAWLCMYYLGMGLARIPASFHGGTP